MPRFLDYEDQFVPGESDDCVDCKGTCYESSTQLFPELDVCPPGFRYWDRTCLSTSYSTLKTHSEAKEVCNNIGGHLAVGDTKKKVKSIFKFVTMFNHDLINGNHEDRGNFWLSGQRTSRWSNDVDNEGNKQQVVLPHDLPSSHPFKDSPYFPYFNGNCLILETGWSLSAAIEWRNCWELNYPICEVAPSPGLKKTTGDTGFCTDDLYLNTGKYRSPKTRLVKGGCFLKL